MVRGPLSQEEYEEIYAQVPRLTVEVVITSGDGVLLTRRQTGACRGLWHIPGGTVRYGERLVEAVHRVAAEELGVQVDVDRLLGYIEYPSHQERGLDWPVGIAFRAHVIRSEAGRPGPEDNAARWFTSLPEAMHDEQKAFLRDQGLASGGH